MYTVYLIWSESLQKTYTGFTSNLPERLQAHNHLATKGWTLHGRPWVLLHQEVFQTKAEALEKEKWLKTGAGRQWIKKNVLRQTD